MRTQFTESSERPGTIRRVNRRARADVLLFLPVSSVGSIHPMFKRVAILARAGERVEAGTLLATLEAMKIEHRLEAPRDGVVVEVRVGAGEQVQAGSIIALVEEAG